MALEKGLVNQVGFHNHFIGTFRELKRLLSLNILGELLHFSGEAYGPVVIKEKGGPGVPILKKAAVAYTIMHRTSSILFRKLWGARLIFVAPC